MATKTLMTVEEFAQMDTAENEDYESSPILLHGMIRGRAERLIGIYFEANPIGGTVSETDCRVSYDTVRRPGLSIFLGERWQQLGLKTIPLPLRS